MRELELKSLKPLIGTEVRAEVAALSSGRFSDELRTLLLDRGVLVFRDLDITAEEQRAITASLGVVRAGTGGDGLQKVSADHDEAPELAGYVDTTFFWHIDGRSDQTVPCLGGSFRPIRLSPDGGETQFLNTYAAYAGLDADTKRVVDGLRVVHSAMASGFFSAPNATEDDLRRWHTTATATQPLIWQHADGRKSLLLSLAVARVEGMHPADSFDLLTRLWASAMRDEYIYSHLWRHNDLVIWNNTGTLHRARPYTADSGRLLHRFTLEGEEPIRAPGQATPSEV